MSRLQLPLTRMTLLTSIQDSTGDGSPEARRKRAEFISLYNPVVERWCRRWGLREIDAEEVAFEIIEKVLEKLGTFDSSRGRFRCWLKAVTRRAVIDHFGTALRMIGDGKHEDRLAMIACSEALENLGEELDRATDPRIDLLPPAVAAVRHRFQEHTWLAFYENKVLMIPASEVAQRLGVKAWVVHNAACKVGKMLREELQRLQDEQPR